MTFTVLSTTGTGHLPSKTWLMLVGIHGIHEEICENWEVADDLFMILYGSLISNGRDYDI